MGLRLVLEFALCVLVVGVVVFAWAYAKRPPSQEALIGSRFGAAKPPTPQSTLRKAARHISMINVQRACPGSRVELAS